MWDGSMERSLIPSGEALKSASSIRLEIAPIRLRKSRASFMVALNMGFAGFSFLADVSAIELSSILAVLPPCGSAVGTSKELGRGLVSTPCLDEPVECLVIVALRAFSLRLGQGSYLLFLPAYDHNLLPLMGQLANLLVAAAARVAAFSAGHEHLLLSLSGQKRGPAFRTELQNRLCPPALGGEFIC